jgi:hypothetical protein
VTEVRSSWIVLLLGACSYTAPTPITGDDAPSLPDTEPPVDSPPDQPTSARVGTPIAEWHFDALAGTTIADAVPGSPLPLTLSAAPMVTQVSGGLQFDARTNAASAVTPHVNAKIKASNALTLEAWVTPANVTQGSTTYAVVATISVSSMLRNLGIEQRGANWTGRVRTSASSLNADPEVSAVAQVDITKPQHVVLVADATTRTLYVNGVPFETTPSGGGTMTSWDPNYRIRIGDESGANRAWLGTIWFLAIYDRALSMQEVVTNFDAGHDCVGC